MNAVTPINVASADRWEEAARRFSLWRGEALHCFTFTEMAVSKMLLALPDERGHGRMVGARFKSLETALAKLPGAERAHDKLKDFMPLLEDRIALCHGAERVAADRGGKWLARLQWIDFVRPPVRRDRSWDEDEAAEYLVDLRKRGGSLSSALGQLRKDLPVSPAPASTRR